MSVSNSVCVVAVAYPTNSDFIHDFFHSLSQQTYQNFTLIICNDGVTNIQDYINHYNIKSCVVLAPGVSHCDNRKVLFEYAYKKPYEYIILADIDDKFSNNRIETTRKFLKNYDIVVNDLHLFRQSETLHENYISDRIKDRHSIEYSDIEHCNFIGLSNAGIGHSALACLRTLNFENVTALDWYIFSYLLLMGKTAVFTNQCYTLYRQSEDNTIGLQEPDIEKFRFILKVRCQHYKKMSEIEMLKSNSNDQLVDCSGVEDKLLEKAYIEHLQKSKQSNLLWWEI